MPSPPYVRVVVLNWNAAWLTARCLRSLAATTYPADRFEIVVVDNASIDGSVAALREEFRDVAIITNASNLGFAEGNNRAMRDIDHCDAIALVNNDATVEPTWLEQLVATMWSDERIGAVAPKILLESPFASVRLTGAATVEAVLVDGLDVTRRCVYDGFVHNAHHTKPLVIVHTLRGTAVLNVPVSQAQSEIEIRWSETEVTPVAADAVTELVPGGAVTRFTADEVRHRLINSLGTELTPWTEGIERFFGAVDRPHVGVHPTWGFSGGGVLLRCSMLSDVGLFDGNWFAYYEDTDLAWRARRRGWKIVVQPDAVLHHLHGGSAGPQAQGFFFLNYRNWLLTVLRNGSPRQLAAAASTAARLAWGPFRHNVFGPLRRGRRPECTISSAWLRVGFGFAALTPGVVFSRVRRTAPGVVPGEHTPHALMPRTPPRAPTARPNGPRLVYVDVTETLRSGWRAGIQRVVCELVRALPQADHQLELVVICWSPALHSFRRIDTAEYERLLAPTSNAQPERPGAGPSRKRRLLATAMHRSGLAPVVYRIRRRRELAAVPQHHRDLALDRFEPGSVFLDIDASWNPTTQPRSELLEILIDQGVTSVALVHDLIPIRHPEWFIPQLVDVFREHLDAHIAAGSVMLSNSRHTGEDLQRYAAETAGRCLSSTVIPLGTRVPPEGEPSTPARTANSSVRFLIVGTVEPRKGHQSVLDAFVALHQQFPSTELTIVGRSGWHDSVIAQQLDAGIDGVNWLHSATDAELDALYREATAVIVASQTEGFGLPVIEALVRGTPVLSSTGGALPEAGGEFAEYFGPGDVDALIALMTRFCADSDHERTKRQALGQYAPTTWAESAAAVVAALDQTTHEQNRPTP